MVASVECSTWRWPEGTASWYLRRWFHLAEPPGPELEGSARIAGAPVRQEPASVAVPARSQRVLLHVKTRGRKGLSATEHLGDSAQSPPPPASRTFFSPFSLDPPHTSISSVPLSQSRAEQGAAAPHSLLQEGGPYFIHPSLLPRMNAPAQRNSGSLAQTTAAND